MNTASEASRVLRDAERPIVWLSHGFGYGGDLLYYGEIFRTFGRQCDAFAVCVDKTRCFQNPYELPLLPILRFWKIKLTRAVQGAEYETEISLPSPVFLVSLLRRIPRALIVIEFTPVSLLGVIGMILQPSIARVLFVESDPATRGGSMHPIILKLKRWAVARMDAVQTNTEAGRRYLERDLGAEPSRIRVAPYLTSRPPGPDKMPTRPKDILQILFVNSLTKRKGVDQLISAVGRCSAETISRIHLTIVGDGPLRGALERQAEGLGLRDRVTFVGPKAYQDLHAYYTSSDVLAVPSVADYRSLSSFEGLSYGLALLGSTQDGASAESVIEGKNGHLINPADPDGIAAVITVLANNPGIVYRYKEHSRSLYLERYSLDIVAANIFETLRLAETNAKMRNSKKKRTRL